MSCMVVLPSKILGEAKAKLVAALEQARRLDDMGQQSGVPFGRCESQDTMGSNLLDDVMCVNHVAVVNEVCH